MGAIHKPYSSYEVFKKEWLHLGLKFNKAKNRNRRRKNKLP
jgi:hypothetical protein